MSTGNVVQVIGAVVDVEFPRESIPRVYDALILKDGELVLKYKNKLAMALCGRLRWARAKDKKEVWQ